MRNWLFLALGALLIAGVYSPFYTHPSHLFLTIAVVAAFLWLGFGRCMRL